MNAMNIQAPLSGDRVYGTAEEPVWIFGLLDHGPNCQCHDEEAVEFEIGNTDEKNIPDEIVICALSEDEEKEEDTCQIEMQIERSDADVRFRCHSTRIKHTGRYL